MIKLSVCIATYNRADLIGQTLDSLVSQVREGVEIVVVDGASTDDTEKVMSSYAERCPAIRYHRMPAKGGVDRDFCHAVSFAAGEYCWLMTDDDIVKPGAVDTILALLPRKYSLIIVNAEVRDKSLQVRLDPKRLRLAADTFYEPSSREKLFTETANYLTFIGGVVIDRALWNERAKEPYIGTEFIHVGVIFQKDLPGGAFAVSEPALIIRFGNAQWSSRVFEIWQFKWPGLVWSFPGIGDEAKARVSPRNPWDNLLTLILERAGGAYTLFEYKKYLEARFASRWRALRARMITLIPGVVLNTMAVVFFSAIATSFDRLFLYRLKTSRFYYRQSFQGLLQSLKRSLSLF